MQPPCIHWLPLSSYGGGNSGNSMVAAVNVTDVVFTDTRLT